MKKQTKTNKQKVNNLLGKIFLFYWQQWVTIHVANQPQLSKKVTLLAESFVRYNNFKKHTIDI